MYLIQTEKSMSTQEINPGVIKHFKNNTEELEEARMLFRLPKVITNLCPYTKGPLSKKKVEWEREKMKPCTVVRIDYYGLVLDGNKVLLLDNWNLEVR